MKYVILTSCFCNKSSWKWQHRRKNIAIIETDGINMPKQIHPRHKSVKSIVKYWSGLYDGVTDKCQFQQALQQAEELCDKLNEKASV